MAMPMILPQLYSKNNGILDVTQNNLHKYKHLLKWKKEASILEFGFADGKNSQKSLGTFLPSDYKEFVASDVSLKMVEYARANIIIPRSEFVQLDIAAENVPELFRSRFDHIFGFNVLHYVRNPRQAFKNLHTMLKPGGFIFVSFMERAPSDSLFHKLREHPKWGRYRQEDNISPYYYSNSPKEDYLRDIDTAGFKDYSFDVQKQQVVFPTEEQCNSNN